MCVFVFRCVVFVFRNPIQAHTVAFDTSVMLGVWVCEPMESWLVQYIVVDLYKETSTNTHCSGNRDTLRHLQRDTVVEIETLRLVQRDIYKHTL